MRGSGARAPADGGCGSRAGTRRRRRRRAVLEVSAGCERSGGGGRSVAYGAPGRRGWPGGEAAGARWGSWARTGHFSGHPGSACPVAMETGGSPGGGDPGAASGGGSHRLATWARAAQPAGSRGSAAATPLQPLEPGTSTAGSPGPQSLWPPWREVCRWAQGAGVCTFPPGLGGHPPAHSLPRFSCSHSSAFPTRVPAESIVSQLFLYHFQPLDK